MIVTVQTSEGRANDGSRYVSPVRNVFVDAQFVGHLYSCGTVVIHNPYPLPADNPEQQIAEQLVEVDGFEERTIKYNAGLQKAKARESDEQDEDDAAGTSVWVPESFE